MILESYILPKSYIISAKQDFLKASVSDAFLSMKTESTLVQLELLFRLRSPALEDIQDVTRWQSHNNKNI